MCILSIFVYRFAIYYLRANDQMEEMKWDVKTITTGDFTVKIHLTNSVWGKWLALKSTSNSFENFKEYFID